MYPGSYNSAVLHIDGKPIVHIVRICKRMCVHNSVQLFHSTTPMTLIGCARTTAIATPDGSFGVTVSDAGGVARHTLMHMCAQLASSRDAWSAVQFAQEMVCPLAWPYFGCQDQRFYIGRWAKLANTMSPICWWCNVCPLDNINNT